MTSDTFSSDSDLEIIPQIAVESSTEAENLVNIGMASNLLGDSESDEEMPPSEGDSSSDEDFATEDEEGGAERESKFKRLLDGFIKKSQPQKKRRPVGKFVCIAILFASAFVGFGCGITFTNMYGDAYQHVQDIVTPDGKALLFNPTCQQLTSVDHNLETHDIHFTIPLFSYEDWKNNRSMQGYLQIKSAVLYQEKANIIAIPTDHKDSIFLWEENGTLDTTQTKFDIHIEYYDLNGTLVNIYEVACELPEKMRTEAVLKMETLRWHCQFGLVGIVLGFAVHLIILACTIFLPMNKKS